MKQDWCDGFGGLVFEEALVEQDYYYALSQNTWEWGWGEWGVGRCVVCLF